MASTLPSGALGNLADSIKSFVSQSGEDSTAVAKNEAKTVEEPSVEREAVKSHDDNTTVHKEEAATVEHDTVIPEEHEKVDTIIDKEVHQDHYHHKIQPVKDKKVLPTKHTYKENEAEQEFDHRDDTAVKESQQEGSKFHDERKVEETRRTEERAPAQKDEHIHHHVHETVQPVIKREIIEPEVIHTTNHVHETHHLNAEHHATTAAPEITMSDYKKGAGAQHENGETKKGLKGESEHVEPALSS
ncbi:hypothetical protein BJ170DRAFT_727293 [Xylariales sp. AK1849]|nr:hypothetical protein BJ170DRAFT_727293 [Xylariales sp. AK1849]